MSTQSDYILTDDAPGYLAELAPQFVGTEPTRSHPTDAGLDLYAAEDVEVGPDPALIPTGTSMRIPDGFYGQVEDRSSMALRGFETKGGVIDATYTGEIKVILASPRKTQRIAKGEKIAQLVIKPVLLMPPVRVDSLDATDRGDAGFGSTGR